MIEEGRADDRQRAQRRRAGGELQRHRHRRRVDDTAVRRHPHVGDRCVQIEWPRHRDREGADLVEGALDVECIPNECLLVDTTSAVHDRRRADSLAATEGIADFKVDARNLHEHPR